MQAYMEGFAISSAIALTYTHEDTWGLEEWIAKEGEISQLGNVAEVEKKVTLQIHGGTRKAEVVDRNPARKSIAYKEAWEKEEE